MSVGDLTVAVDRVKPYAYLMRLRLPEPEVADQLARELRDHGSDVEVQGDVVVAVWHASEADDVDIWSEYTFPELVFFLRSWAGEDPARRIEVLEERPLTEE